MSRVRYEDLDQEVIDQLAQEAVRYQRRKQDRAIERALRQSASRFTIWDALTLAGLGAFVLGSWVCIIVGVHTILVWAFGG